MDYLWLRANSKTVVMVIENGCHFVSFVMHISGVKFEEHFCNISRDILGSVIYCLSEDIYDVITFLICIIQKCQYLSNEKGSDSKRKTPLFFILKSLSKKQQSFCFYSIGT